MSGTRKKVKTNITDLITTLNQLSPAPAYPRLATPNRSDVEKSMCACAAGLLLEAYFKNRKLHNDLDTVVMQPAAGNVAQAFQLNLPTLAGNMHRQPAKPGQVR